jgi:alpha-N-arabinofuranosidase
MKMQSKRPFPPVAALLMGGLIIGAAIPPALATVKGEIRVVIDPAAAGPEINPYLYGEFIEHLGRCIYGGIWAEMLKDRKFLLPEKDSPWKTVGAGPDFDRKADPAGEFAGVPCAALWLRNADGRPHGLRQEGLGVVAGKTYVGSIWLAAAGKPAPVTVGFVLGPGDRTELTFEPAGAAYQKFDFRFVASGTTDDAAVEISVAAPAYVWIGAVSLMPAENVRGMRPDTLSLIKELAPPLIRWPGGNFVSGYRWKDGIGPRDRRPPRYEKAWNDIEPNDFGLDEFMDFCREVGTDPYICVNAGLGPAEEAAEEVEYANGPATSPWGARRAANGHPAPYGVRVWGIGNEMFGDWQLGNVAVEQYRLRHDAFAGLMRDKDPSIRLIGVGAPGAWNDAMVRSAASMDWLSEHYYQERNFRIPFSKPDLEAYGRLFPGYTGIMAADLGKLVEAFRDWKKKAGDAGASAKLAIDEWGIVREWKSSPDGPGIGAYEHYYPLGDALAVARGLHEILRSADVCTMANWAQTVNVIGLIKTSRTAASMEPPGLVLELYRRWFGDVLVPVKTAAGGPVDIVASSSKDGREMAIGLVNPSLSETYRVRLDTPGGFKKATARIFRIQGPGVGAINVPGASPAVTLKEAPKSAWRGRIDLPPHSITLVRLK